jgi:hypothetical protein
MEILSEYEKTNPKRFKCLNKAQIYERAQQILDHSEKEIIERMRFSIMYALEKGYKKEEIGNMAGYSGAYVVRILGREYLPKSPRHKLSLLLRFTELLDKKTGLKELLNQRLVKSQN